MFRSCDRDVTAPSDRHPGDLLRLGALFLGGVLARVAARWPLGALWGPAMAAILVALIAPVWIAAAVRTPRAGRAGVAHAAGASFLFLGGTFAISSLPDRSHFGVAGHVAAALFAVVACAWIADGDLQRFGLQLDLREPRTRRALAWVGGVLVGLFAVSAALLAAKLMPRTWWQPPGTDVLETLVFQFVIVAVAEELAWRGFLQSYIDRLVPGRIQLAGAELGWGVLVSSLLFALVHMTRLELDPLRLGFSFQPYRIDAFLYGYLRAYTGSVWPCVALHGLWNGLGNLLGYLAPHL